MIQKLINLDSRAKALSINIEIAIELLVAVALSAFILMDESVTIKIDVYLIVMSQLIVIFYLNNMCIKREKQKEEE